MVDSVKDEIRSRAGIPQPAIDNSAGEYPLSEARKVQTQTIEDGVKLIQAADLPLKTSDDTRLRYGVYDTAVVADSFSSSLSGIIGLSPEKVAGTIARELMSTDLLSDLDNDFTSYDTYLDRSQPTDERKELLLDVGKVPSDVRRGNEIRDTIEQTGRYFPPFFHPTEGVLDGAHRVAALLSIGVDHIYAWEHLG